MNLFRRDADAVVAAANAIEEQARATQLVRERREHFVSSFALEQNLPAETSLRQLIPLFPADVQPLVQALSDEINHLIHRIRRDARQNQQILSRTVELHEETLRQLRPEAFSKTYSPRGAVSLNPASAWQAAG